MVPANQNASDTPTPHSESLRAKRLRAARALWLVVVLISLVTFIFGLRAGTQFLFNTPWLVYLNPQFTADGFRSTPIWTDRTMVVALAGLGLTPVTFAVIQIALSLLKFFIFTALGIILFVKRPNNGFALYISLLMMLSGTFLGFLPVFPTAQWLGILDSLLHFSITIGIFTLAYLFPDGRFVPSWSRWLLIIWIVVFPLALLLLFFLFQASRAIVENFLLLELVALVFLILVLIGLSLGLVAAQIYRYRFISTPVQRQQSKWFAFAVLFFVAETIILSVLPYFYPSLVSPTVTGLAFAILRDIANVFAWVVLPIGIAVAILRYRLWDIDVLINRTLVYLPLTAILAGVFSVTSSLTEKAFLTFATQPNSPTPEAATVLTTLIVVAIFEPLKKRLSDFVDKHFKEPPDPLKALKAYRARVEMVLDVMDSHEIARNTLTSISRAYDVTGAALFWGKGDSAKPLYEYGAWDGNSHLRVPLVLDDGTELGRIELGARKKGREFTAEDLRLLQENLDLVERALVLAQQLHPRSDSA